MIQRTAYLILGTLIGAVTVTAILHAQAAAQDAVKLSPQYYTVRYENDRLRVVDYRLKPGQKEVMHTHQPGVAYIVSGAKLRTSFPDGTAAEGMLQTGDVHGRDKSVTHAVENIGDTEAHAIIVELKN